VEPQHIEGYFRRRQKVGRISSEENPARIQVDDFYISQRFFISRYAKKKVNSPTKSKYIHSRDRFDILPSSKRIDLIGS
jgi:hypothetical protein